MADVSLSADCKNCKTVIARPDVQIKDGQLQVSPDFICPNCGKPAGGRPLSTRDEDQYGEEFKIRQGKITQ